MRSGATSASDSQWAKQQREEEGSLDEQARFTLMLRQADDEQEQADGRNGRRSNDDVGTTHAPIEHFNLPCGGPNTHDPR